MHKAALMAPRVECEALRSADHNEGFATSIVERDWSDREGRLIFT